MCRTGNRPLVPTTGIDGSSHAGITYCIAMAPSFGVGLPFRRCGGECRQRKARSLDARQRRVRRKIDVDPARVGNLRHEADVGERRRVAVTEARGLLFVRELSLERLEPDVDPVLVPAILLLA